MPHGIVETPHGGDFAPFFPVVLVSLECSLQEQKLVRCQEQQAQEQQAISAEAALPKHDLILHLRQVRRWLTLMSTELLALLCYVTSSLEGVLLQIAIRQQGLLHLCS